MTESKRTTIHLAPPILAILGNPPEPSMSGRIADIVRAYAQLAASANLTTSMEDFSTLNTMLVRYRAITEDAMPTLTEAEWSLLMDVLNGTFLFAENAYTDPARFLWAEVADSEPDGTGEKWGVDVPAFAAQLRALPHAARCAIMDVAGRFWNSPNLNSLSTRDLLIEAGAKIGDTP